ncbi:MAG: PHP domain-containing protein [Clostridia bacterium]|nr:PHP domain-containing protein [Clostridia bacterium]
MKFFYDLHIHSCLSPCGDDDMTPADIAGIGALNGLSVMALTDHNSCENCPAFFEACEFYGIIPVAGMELTTAEDIHIVCLFRTLEKALKFSDFVYSRIMPIKNNPEIFGNQNVTDTDGNIIRTLDKLLISATDISVDELPDLISEYDGVCYPAHIDRDSNGIITILGDIPPEPGFKCFEIHNKNKLEEYKKNYPSTNNMSFISSSDAHRLCNINPNVNHFEIPENYKNSVIDWIFNFISGQNY